MRFSLHDGPGIRTTVFLKGCPLSCLWCHNPESQSRKPEVMYAEDRCVRCGDCVKACEHGALTWADGPIRDLSRCLQCGECAKACFADARRMVGECVSVSEIVARLRRDLVFFDQSGGGVTFSGGEPLMQPEFLFAALKSCKAQGIHTAVDTCGHASLETMARIASVADLFLFDVKLVDPERHKEFTGVSNVLILKNLASLVESKKRVMVRIPVVPGVNDDEANITASMDLLSRMGVQHVDLLSYHQTGTEKYQRLGSKYELQNLVPPSPEMMNDLSDRFCREGFTVRIGG
jgi:pyruvate formate lyase activating enzyme